MAYRLAEGVDVDAGGVTHIGYVQAGEWVEYTVNVPAAGTYPTAFRVGSWYPELGTRSIAVSVDGSAKGTVTVPLTGSDTAYQTVTVPLALNAGTQTIRLTFSGPRQNLDWFEIGTGAVPSTTVTTTTTQQPGGQTAYNGPHALPGTVQGEDFDNGGQNVAYYDSTVENKAKTNNIAYADRGNEYVDAETGNGISDIGWITDGEWTEYTVDAAAGSYTATFRVASWANDRRVVLTVDGNTGCTVNVPNTGSSEVYQTVSAPLTLTAGSHVIRLTFQGNAQNLDWFSVAGGAVTTTTTTTPVPTTTVTTTTTTQPGGQAAYNGPHAAPGRVQAEDFDYGGQNVAYYDSTAENKAANTAGVTAYRPTEAVDAETGNGISDIGWITGGEWTEYTVDAAAGSYTATFRVASWVDGRQVVLTVDGNPGCTVNVPNTGSPDVYQEVSAPLSLTAGQHVIRLTFQGSIAEHRLVRDRRTVV